MYFSEMVTQQHCEFRIQTFKARFKVLKIKIFYCTYAVCAGAHVVQKTFSPLKLELQVALNNHLEVLRINLGSL